MVARNRSMDWGRWQALAGALAFQFGPVGGATADGGPRRTRRPKRPTMAVMLTVFFLFFS